MQTQHNVNTLRFTLFISLPLYTNRHRICIYDCYRGRTWFYGQRSFFLSSFPPSSLPYSLSFLAFLISFLPFLFFLPSLFLLPFLPSSFSSLPPCFLYPSSPPSIAFSLLSFPHFSHYFLLSSSSFPSHSLLLPLLLPFPLLLSLISFPSFFVDLPSSLPSLPIHFFPFFFSLFLPSLFTSFAPHSLPSLLILFLPFFFILFLPSFSSFLSVFEGNKRYQRTSTMAVTFPPVISFLPKLLKMILYKRFLR